jgi:hypothetical protein
MSTDDDTTPKLAATPARRVQSQTERDASGLAARREREGRVMALADEEVTGNHQGDELRALRSRRPTPQRIAHIEERVDGVITTISEWRGEVSKQMGELTGEVKGLAGEVKGLATVVQNSGQRDHVTFKATVDVDTAQKIDQVDAGKTKRAWITQVLTLVGSALALATAAFAAGRC